MKYRKLGKLDWKPSALGFGCMRLPTIEGTPLSSNILENEAIEMIRNAIDEGINYFDTAYFYHSGQSEVLLGKALKDGYRDKVKIADKSPLIYIKKAEMFNKYLNEQLERLDVDFIDFYLLHGLNSKTWEIVKREGLLELAEAAQKAGKIGHIGFSFHDEYEVFENIINGYDKWDLCQIQYNFMDTDFQAGTKGLKLAATKDIGVVVMEPLKGGKLANPIPDVSKLIEQSGNEQTLVDLSLQWLWDKPEVSVVLSGMSENKQIIENIESASKSGINTLSQQNAKLISEIKEIYEIRPSIPCTGCSYCMPCPQEINIPQVLDFYNEGIVYNYFEESKRMYILFGRQGNNCVGCKECEEKCPQSLDISNLMRKTDDKLTQ